MVFQDVKSDNAAEDSNEEDTKNGEKEKDDESSDEEEHTGNCSSIAEFCLCVAFSRNLLYVFQTACNTHF